MTRPNDYNDDYHSNDDYNSNDDYDNYNYSDGEVELNDIQYNYTNNDNYENNVNYNNYENYDENEYDENNQDNRNSPGLNTFNRFIQSTMIRLRSLDPSLTNTQAMSRARDLWDQQRNYEENMQIYNNNNYEDTNDYENNPAVY